MILRIESRFGPLSYPAAKFTTWQDNLRAITLGLNGLRRLDRYGITPGSEQYTGWKQLPSAGQSSVATPNADDAEKFLRDLTGNYDAPLDKVYRASRREMHPDRHDNDQEMWDRVEAAGDVLRRAGRLT
ncbi:molecular chaperone DnaJ [Mycobacteroides abscessus]|uniref:molecular chaperone DnaJ n=1 Tax=Mycobacteroides abscessus TaxID=36809 RepID=UPI000940B2E7|nr:molecular chaperone DnaJ [Mycobacteroides abscessus]MDO3312688.1 molecular chaperone DnaJ [Mycobacteroides abscessus subsp. abscessus]MDO3344630.1 molecular chaperone DnaJ [Mycobacteroides abscessus subsp. abscessus]